MRVWWLVLALGIALGCTGKDDDDDEGDDTSENGIPQLNPVDADADADVDADVDADADADTSADTSADTDTDPVLLDVRTSIEDYPDIGWVMEVTLTYTDPNQDVDGGLVMLDATLDEAAPEQFQIPIDGSQAIHDADDGTVFLAIQVSDAATSGTLSVTLVDANGHHSNTLTVTIG